MTGISVQDARAKFAELLNAVLYRGEHVTITRHSRPVAVLVPPDWYERAVAALAEHDQA